MLNDLSDYTWRDEEQLLSLGLKRSEQNTGDPTRSVMYWRVIGKGYDVIARRSDPESTAYLLVLAVRFTLYISDDPTAASLDNFQYDFERVVLRVHGDSQGAIEFQTGVQTLRGLRYLVETFAET